MQVVVSLCLIPQVCWPLCIASAGSPVAGKKWARRR